MSDEELKLILKEFETVRVEMLDDNARRLFYAIMKIADERDDLQKENQKLDNDIKILLKENEAKEKVIIKYDNVLNELEKWLIEDNYKNEDVWCITTQEVLKKIKELKESDK